MLISLPQLKNKIKKIRLCIVDIKTHILFENCTKWSEVLLPEKVNEQEFYGRITKFSNRDKTQIDYLYN